jgi:enhancing lycopene biosynthesis protein 2
MSKVAVVLSGCGFLDGSEIHEAVSVLIHLSRHEAAVSCFAPDINVDAVNHVTKSPMEAKRNVLVESARIARGSIEPLAKLKAADFDAVVFPGGFGAAKNLSTFATQGAACTVNADVERVVKEFHTAKKPIGMCCIAPVIGAKVLGTKAGGPGVRVTLGEEGGAAQAVAAMGSTHVAKPVTAALADESQKVFTSPAYMYGEATPSEVYEGIGAMVDGVMGRVGK